MFYGDMKLMIDFIPAQNEMLEAITEECITVLYASRV